MGSGADLSLQIERLGRDPGVLRGSGPGAAALRKARVASPGSPWTADPSATLTLRSRTIDIATGARARIILASHEGRPAAELADALGISPRRVHKWIWRFDEEGLEGLKERPRSGRPRRLDLDAEMGILTKTVEEDPPGAAHWSLRLMAQAMVQVPLHTDERLLAQCCGVLVLRLGTLRG